MEAMGEVRNYARFYALLKELPYDGDREELKTDLVSQATNGRTESLKETTKEEYQRLCSMMEGRVPERRRLALREMRKALRRQRSMALHQMQLWGVDTANWDKVNAFCEDKRICGKTFRELDITELEALTLKVRAMIWKRKKQEED